MVLLLLLSISTGNAQAYTCQIQRIQITPTAPAPNKEITITVYAFCDLAQEGAIVSFFTTIVKLMPTGVNHVIATEPIPNGSNDTRILIFTPSTPQLWNLTAEVDAIQTSGAGQLVSMAQQNFTIPVGMQAPTNTPTTSSVTNNQTSTTAAITELIATTIITTQTQTETQTTTSLSSINPYLQLSTTILVAALVVTLFVLRNSRKKPEDIP